MPASRQLQTIFRYAICTMMLAIGLRTWVVMGLIDPVIVAGSSMEPTLRPGDRLWVNRSVFSWRSPQRGDIIVARNPTNGCELCVKRIVGLPGEHISIEDSTLHINGEPISPSGVQQSGRQQTEPETDFAPLPWKSRQWQLLANEYFLLGDNPSISIDSRLWGPVSADLLLGKPLGVR